MSRNPRYDEIMQKMIAMPREYAHSDEGRLLLSEALSLAPPDIKALMDAKLKELDLMPESTFCDDQGNAVFTLEQVAAKFGTTVEEVKQHMEECTAHHPGAFKHTGAVHRVH